jgi:outer membrane receptor for ferrienterochelin and colicins
VSQGRPPRRQELVARALVFVALLLLCALPLAAQQRGTITVFVRGPDGPLAGAAIVSGEAVIRADERGIARFALPPGTHSFRVQRSGFITAHITLLLPAPRDTSLVVRLIEPVDHGDPIYVFSTRGDRRIEDEPLRVEIITRDEIEEKLLMTPGSIAMLLHEAAGVRVQETNPALGGASVRIHGLRGRYTQILVDGLPLHGVAGGTLGPLQIPPMDVSQVEVIKGTASALYGGAALGGVINLVTRRPERGREMLANRTSRGGTDVVAWSSDPVGRNWGYTLLASLHAQDQTDIGGDGWAELPRHRRFVVRPRIFRTNGANRIMLTSGFMSESRTGGGFVPGGARIDYSGETQRSDVGGTARIVLNESLHLTLRGSATQALHMRTIAGRREDDTRVTSFGELAVRGQARAYAWIVGAALQYESLDADRIDPELGFAHLTPGVFAQNELTIAPWLSVTLSGRVDVHEEHNAFFSPRGAVLFGPFGIWTLRFSGGTGYRAPTPLVEEVDEIGLARIEPPGELRPERARSYSADLGAAAARIEFNATLFGSLVTDPIVFVPPAEPGAGRLVNLPGRTQTVGTDVSLRVRSEGFSMSAFHTYTRATEPDAASLRRLDLPLTPRHATGVVAMMEGENWGRTGVEAYHTGRQRIDDDPALDHAPPYTVVGLLLERRVGPVRLFVNAENLTNVRQTRTRPLVRSEPTTTGRWTTDVHAPLEGRVVNGGFRVFF